MHLKTDTQGANAHFAQVPTISKPRSAFSVAEKHVTTIQFDYLYPIFWKMIYPGDTLSIQTRFLARLQTQIAPLYDDLYIDLHAWYVPLRLLQTNWARFQYNAQPGGPSQDNSALTTPSIDLVGLGAGGFTSKSLYDYLGYPTKINLTSNLLWINNYAARCYNFIYNNDYRDENLQNPVTVDLTEGPDTASNYVLLKAGKRFDIFTSCLTAQQKGTAVSLPFGTTANVYRTLNAQQWAVYDAGANTNPPGSGTVEQLAGGPLTYFDGAVQHSASLSPGSPPGASALYADLTGAVATLNQLRSSYAIQHLLEADARGGTRDVEAIQHRFGVTVPDFRLQRPEWCGGSTMAFDPHIVPQTSETATTPQATLTQFSQTLGNLSVTHSFQEQGIFMIIVRARSNMTYQQGLWKELAHKTRFDFYQPEFANIGEVALYNYEIMCQGTSADNNVFGFNEYAYWMRYGLNRVSGEMRSNYATPLDSRHMADDYLSLPTLGAAWIQNNTPISRNIAVSAATADPIQFNFFTTGKFARTLPMYSVPGLRRM